MENQEYRNKGVDNMRLDNHENIQNMCFYEHSPASKPRVRHLGLRD